MEKTERITFVVSPAERDVIKKLAEIEGGLSEAATIRRLIRRAAQDYGFWPPTVRRQNDN